MVQVTLTVAAISFGRTARAEDGSPQYTGTVVFEIPERGLSIPCRFRVADKDQATVAAAKNLRTLLSWIDAEAQKLIPTVTPAADDATRAAAADATETDPPAPAG